MKELRPDTPRVLIIGWGFIGAALGHRLLKDGIVVTGLTRSQTWRTAAGRRAGARIVVGDACQTRLLEETVRTVDHIVFAAGGLSPPAAAARPSEAAMRMLLPLLAVLETLRHSPTVAMTYISSGGTVYGDPLRLPVRETDPTEPVSPYGALHLAGELYAQMYARRFGAQLQVVRCANVYGPQQARQGDQGAVAIFLHRIAHGLPIRIFGDGSAVRDYVFVDDVAAVLARLIVDRLAVGVVNLGSGRGLSVLEVVHASSDVVGRRAIVEFEPERGFDVRAVVLDITRLQSFVPYTPTDFPRGLRVTAEASRDVQYTEAIDRGGVESSSGCRLTGEEECGGSPSRP